MHLVKTGFPGHWQGNNLVLAEAPGKIKYHCQNTTKQCALCSQGRHLSTYFLFGRHLAEFNTQDPGAQEAAAAVPPCRAHRVPGRPSIKLLILWLNITAHLENRNLKIHLINGPLQSRIHTAATLSGFKLQVHFCFHSCHFRKDTAKKSSILNFKG